MCCGQSRRQYQAGKTSSRINQRQTVAREPVPVASSVQRQQASVSNPYIPHAQHSFTNTYTGGNEVALQYLQTTSILVKGPISGRQYTFSGQKPNQTVDARDVEPLLKTGFFRKRYR
jgi:hypothetical protein